MPNHKSIRKLWVVMPVFIAFTLLLIIPRTTILISNNSYFGTTNLAYGQPDQMNSNVTNSLNIQKADVLGYSMGSFVAQQITVTHTEKVNKLILVAASCRGKEGIPRSPQLVKMVIDFANKILNHISTTPQEAKQVLSMSFGS